VSGWILDDFRCDDCDNTFEQLNRVAERDETECPDCGKKATRLVPQRRTPVSEYAFPAGYWEHVSLTGEHFTSRRQLADYCKQHGKYAKYLDGYSGIK
jgi:putative FmdB family regulatory protein